MCEFPWLSATNHREISVNTLTLESPYRLPVDLIPGVLPWPADFRDDFNRWAADFFGPHPAPVPPLVVAPCAAPARTATRRTKTQRARDSETFSELLEHLGDTFDTIEIPAIKGNWLPKHDIRALHKLGIHVPHPWLLDIKGRTVATKTFPTMASVHMIPSRYDKKDTIHPRFAFAIKEPRLPLNVEQFKGAAYYRFGICVHLPELEKDDTSPLRSFWVWCYMVVLADGTAVCPHELRQHSNIAHAKRAAPGCDKMRGSRRVSWVSREWNRPTLMQGDKPGDGYEQYMTAVFCQLLNWWTSRADCWSVAVTKDGKRVTFSIAQDQTSAYFADRDKTIKAADGTAKKILHYVRPHTRENGATVREHVRGLREFDWLGYRCTVTAPNLTGQVVSSSFDLVGTVVQRKTPDMLDSVEVATMLAKHEDRDVRSLRH